MAYDNSMTAHVWAQQEKQTGRSGNGNMSFADSTLFSYSTPIGRFVTAPNGARVTLVTSNTYSTTTSGKHMPALWRAIDYGRGQFAPCFAVPRLSGQSGLGYTHFALADSDHVANLEYLVGEYAAQIAKLNRCQFDNVDHVSASARKALATARAYAETFALDMPADSADSDIAVILAKREARATKNATPAAIVRRERDKAQRAEIAAERQRLQHADAHERLEGWRNGTLARLDRYSDIRSDMQAGALLRIRGNTLETSQGASVPLDHAKRVFAAVKRCKDSGATWQRNGETIRVGHFQVDSIDANGNFRAGCHLINWPETERAAIAAGVIT